jgi:hypothetical protein
MSEGYPDDGGLTEPKNEMSFNIFELASKTFNVTGQPVTKEIQAIFGFNGLTVKGLEVMPNHNIHVFYACGQMLIYTPHVALVGERS